MGIWFNVSLAVFAAAGSFLFGYDAGVMTDVIVSPNFLHFFNTKETEPIVGAIVSTFSGGAVFGSLMGGETMDRIGRKRTVQLGAIICLVGAILQAAATNLAMMLVGRIVAGWSVGLMSMSVPVYQSECAHPSQRGMIVGITQQMIGVGFIVSTWVGFGSSKMPDSSSFQWRFPLAFQIVPCIILVVGLFFFPESPRKLIEDGKTEEALRVLHRLHYNGSNEDWIEQEFTEIKMTIEAEKEVVAPGWAPMFTVPQWRYRLLHATLVQVFTQMTGINVINTYQPIMYKTLGFEEKSKNLLITGIYNCIGPLTNLVFITFIIDRVGRVKPLLFGTISISIALICEAAIGSQIKEGKNGLSIAGVFFLFCVTILFSLSFGPVSWVYMSEILPMQIRGKGSAFATGIGNWLVNTFWTQISPIAMKHLGPPSQYKYFFVFLCWNILVTLPVTFFMFKETKEKSLEEIDLLFGERAVGHLTTEEIEAHKHDEKPTEIRA